MGVHGDHPPRWTSRAPFLIAAVLLLSIGFLIVVKVTTASGATSARAIDGVRCDQAEQVAYHVHVHLDIIDAGRPVTIPAQVGIPSGGQCLYWIHTHDTSGVIHVEAPANERSKALTLGDFMDVWGRGPITGSSVAGVSVRGAQALTVIVDGRPYTGDPNAIPLQAHRRITLEIVPPEMQQPAFAFRDGQ
jgi:hypothetical protein